MSAILTTGSSPQLLGMRGAFERFAKFFYSFSRAGSIDRAYRISDANAVWGKPETTQKQSVGAAMLATPIKATARILPRRTEKQAIWLRSHTVAGSVVSPMQAMLARRRLLCV